MADRKEDRKYAWYVCGKCKHEIYRLKGEEDIVPCNECGAVYKAASGNAIDGGTLVEIRPWNWKTREPSDVPDEVKYPL